MNERLKLFSTNEVVACDFDGTITYEDVCDKILKTFAIGDWLNVGKSYEEGLISHEEMNRRFVGMLTASPEDIEAFIKREINIREDFYEFLTACRKQGISPLLISSGWDIYIRILLSNSNVVFLKSFEDLQYLSDDCLPVICNHVFFDKNSLSWRIDFPWVSDNQQSTPDKAAIVNYLRSNGIKNIIAVGDGLSDRGMAKSADFVFSRDILTKYCETHEIRNSEFNTFAEISATIEYIKKNVLRVLSLPSYHPYNKRFDNGRDLVFANPDNDLFSNKYFCTPKYFEKHYPPESYDVVHIHFEYYLIPISTLEDLLKYFKKKNKPIVWTCHDRKSHSGNDRNSEYELLLYKYSDRVTTLRRL